MPAALVPWLQRAEKSELTAQFRHHTGTTYVAVDDSEGILGFATVAASEIASEAVPEAKTKRLPRYLLLVLRLARLAVDERAKGQGVGALLLRAVLLLAQQMASDMACVGVVVDARPDAIAFHEKLGFLRLSVTSGELGDRPQPTPMFLAVNQVVQAAESG